MTKRTGLIATKIGNSSYFDGSGKNLPVTILKVSDCVVSNIKTHQGYQFSRSGLN